MFKGEQPMSLIKLVVFYKHQQHDQSTHAPKKSKSSKFYKGATTSVEEMFQGSSKTVQNLAIRTGILASDQNSYNYIKAKYDSAEMRKIGKPEKGYPFKYKTIQKELTSSIGKEHVSLTGQHADKSFLELSEMDSIYKHTKKRGVGIRMIRKSVDTSLTELSPALHDMSGKFGTPLIKKGAFPDLTDTEKALMGRLSARYTKGQGIEGTRMQKEVEAMTDDDRRMLHSIAHKYSVQETVTRTISDSITTHAEKEKAHIEAKLVGTKRSTALKRVTMRTKARLKNLPEVLQKVHSIQPEESTQVYLDRVLNDKGFQSLIPETKSGTVKKTANFNTMLGLSTVSEDVKQGTLDRYSKMWDKRNHKFRGRINDVFEITHPDVINKKWERAVKKETRKCSIRLLSRYRLRCCQRDQSNGF